MKLTGMDIRRQEFPTRLRGYDRPDVDAFLQLVADSVDELLRKYDDLVRQCAELTQQLKATKEREETLQRALVAVNELREEANSRASALLQRAESEASRIAADAEEAGRKIREEAERDVRRLREEMAKLAHLREKMIRDLSGMLRSQLRIVESETERLGLDLSRLAGGEGGKIVSLNQKAEGERS